MSIWVGADVGICVPSSSAVPLVLLGTTVAVTKSAMVGDTNVVATVASIVLGAAVELVAFSLLSPPSVSTEVGDDVVAIPSSVGKSVAESVGAAVESSSFVVVGVDDETAAVATFSSVGAREVGTEEESVSFS